VPTVVVVVVTHREVARLVLLHHTLIGLIMVVSQEAMVPSTQAAVAVAPVAPVLLGPLLLLATVV
jgi:hypothetical protein